MSFVTALALAVVALVAAPLVAHRLRRKQAEERPFAAVRLVDPSPPRARRRARIEDRSLFAIRTASIVVLALLGASPLVKCSRVAMNRGGASVAVAIVLDDSMSMRASSEGKESRFARAKDGAAEVLGALREGDAAALVFAGAPARVGLAATTDIGAVRAALREATPSDRGTDLDGAIAIAQTLIGELPQVDRRVVVLSDLADGRPDAPALGEGAKVPVWVAMPELAGPLPDCALVTADRAAAQVRVRFACDTAASARGRNVRLLSGDDVVASVKLPEAENGEVLVPPPRDASGELVAALDGKDAIATDDVAPVATESGPAALGVVTDRPDDAVATGGAPVLEQALGALRVDLAVRPIPEAPDRREDLAPFAALFVDDPPGFTPEQRRALGGFVERGGMLFVALGPRASAAPLGATFEPFLRHAVAWGDTSVAGADPNAPLLGDAARGLADLAPRGRARIDDADVEGMNPVVRWADGEPLVTRRAFGRGEAWLSTLPFSVETSDLALRPAFLALIDAFLGEVRQRATKTRGEVGVPWTFPGAKTVEVTSPEGPVAATREDALRDSQRGEGALRVVPAVVGRHRVVVDGSEEVRVAVPVAREVDLRPRKVAPSARESGQGGGVAVVDVSWVVALVLLALVALEIAARARMPSRAAS